ncbi:terminase gpA endonuclease subunit [Prosthecobacter dejongeii]|uniref:Phage terminase large subunit GpA-like protein n=1 Tax=Prosthecobacter dejongeii TaxID=48465 RepID=A0A7W8DQ18_9BACT|nr:terminase gpA endonuclease subunit [Prosthecobacter dejongeii]MBB5038254.1 phage terminase large subunit GpA-like protein [Prosthecobacter dejongeii]
MIDLTEWGRGLLGRVIRPRPKGGIAKWGHENIALSSEESAGAPGPYRVELEPWTSIVFKFIEDPRYDLLYVAKASRMGFTLAFFVAMMWWLTHFGTNIIFAIDKSKEVKRIARKRIIPLIKSVRALRDVLPSNDRALTTETLYLKGKTVFLAGAQSLSQVLNKTASLICADELDQFENFKSGEINAHGHLLDRMMDVLNAKGIFGGKPRNEEDITWQEYLTGTRHQLFVPCPHCETMQVLDPKNMRYDHCRTEDGDYDGDRVANDAFWQCINPECRLDPARHHGRIDEKHKLWMLEMKDHEFVRAEFRQTNFGQDDDKPEPRKMSVQIGQQYSLRPKLTWGAIALHWIKASKKGGTELAHFYRTRFGMPYRQKQTIIKGEMVKALAKGSVYRHGECPVLPCFVAMAVDVQELVKKWSKVAFLPSGEAFIIDYGECLAFEDLYEIAEKPIKILDWGDIPESERDPHIMVNFVWIDEGNGDGDQSTKDVRDFCARPRSRNHPLHGGHWIYPCKGAGGLQIKGVVDERDRKVDSYEFKCYHLSHNEFATELYLQRIGQHEEICAAMEIMARSPHKRLPLPAPRLWLMKNPDDEFIAELCAEKRQLKKVRGRLRWVWVDPTEKNDYGDTVKYCLAMWYFIRELYGWEAPDDEPETDASKPAQKEREYILHRDED